VEHTSNKNKSPAAKGGINHQQYYDEGLSAVRFRNVGVNFSGPDGTTKEVLEDVSLEIGLGKFVALVGPTGCGKSTLLNLASGILPPTTGSIEVVAGMTESTAYMFQGDTLLPWRTLLDNVALPLVLRGTRRSVARDEAAIMLHSVGLTGFKEFYPARVSGGMRKRAALAQMLIYRPRLLLMDEPFAALDALTRIRMHDLLGDLWSAYQSTVIFITHDLEEAISLADEVVVMSAGPSSRPCAHHAVNIPHPRQVEEVRMTKQFNDIFNALWEKLRSEVNRSIDV
jgi:NitT/TauT family transport system ATP-binding protein